jgi:hypothetical protein
MARKKKKDMKKKKGDQDKDKDINVKNDKNNETVDDVKDDAKPMEKETKKNKVMKDNNNDDQAKEANDAVDKVDSNKDEEEIEDKREGNESNKTNKEDNESKNNGKGDEDDDSSLKPPQIINVHRDGDPANVSPEIQDNKKEPLNVPDTMNSPSVPYLASARDYDIIYKSELPSKIRLFRITQDDTLLCNVDSYKLHFDDPVSKVDAIIKLFHQLKTDFDCVYHNPKEWDYDLEEQKRLLDPSVYGLDTNIPTLGLKHKTLFLTELNGMDEPTDRYYDSYGDLLAERNRLIQAVDHDQFPFVDRLLYTPKVAKEWDVLVPTYLSEIMVMFQSIHYEKVRGYAFVNMLISWINTRFAPFQKSASLPVGLIKELASTIWIACGVGYDFPGRDILTLDCTRDIFPLILHNIPLMDRIFSSCRTMTVDKFPEPSLVNTNVPTKISQLMGRSFNRSNLSDRVKKRWNFEDGKEFVRDLVTVLCCNSLARLHYDVNLIFDDDPSTFLEALMLKHLPFNAFDSDSRQVINMIIIRYAYRILFSGDSNVKFHEDWLDVQGDNGNNLDAVAFIDALTARVLDDPAKIITVAELTNLCKTWGSQPYSAADDNIAGYFPREFVDDIDINDSEPDLLTATDKLMYIQRNVGNEEASVNFWPNHERDRHSRVTVAIIDFMNSRGARRDGRDAGWHDVSKFVIKFFEEVGLSISSTIADISDWVRMLTQSPISFPRNSMDVADNAPERGFIKVTTKGSCAAGLFMTQYPAPINVKISMDEFHHTSNLRMAVGDMISTMYMISDLTRTLPRKLTTRSDFFKKVIASLPKSSWSDVLINMMEDHETLSLDTFFGLDAELADVTYNHRDPGQINDFVTENYSHNLMYYTMFKRHMRAHGKEHGLCSELVHFGPNDRIVYNELPNLPKVYAPTRQDPEQRLFFSAFYYTFATQSYVYRNVGNENSWMHRDVKVIADVDDPTFDNLMWPFDTVVINDQNEHVIVNFAKMISGTSENKSTGNISMTGTESESKSSDVTDLVPVLASELTNKGISRRMINNSFVSVVDILNTDEGNRVKASRASYVLHLHNSDFSSIHDLITEPPHYEWMSFLGEQEDFSKLNLHVIPQNDSIYDGILQLCTKHTFTFFKEKFKIVDDFNTFISEVAVDPL